MSTGKGLAGITAADSSLSRVDGEKGELIYRGYNILDLGENACFEEVVYLLWNGELPNRSQLDAFKIAIESKQSLPADIVAFMRKIPHEAHPMAVLRTVVSSLGLIDPHEDDNSLEGGRKKALLLTAVFPTIIATWERIRTGQEIVAPKQGLGIAANFLYMLTGEEPGSEATAVLDAYLVLLADHGFNASTFASRVTTGTLADMYSAVTT
ncbi:MAG: citrate synthase, partial [Chloroflexi bacterium]|nr:citrate synthase [Chloroflexota bacterium]